MDVNQHAELQVLLRARTFLDDHADELGAIYRAPARRALDDLIRRIEQAAAAFAESSSASIDRTKIKAAVHARLRREMGRIRVLATARKEEMQEIQTFKSASRSTSDTSLKADATAIALAISGHGYEPILAREGFGDDYLERFRALITEFEQSVGACMVMQSRRHVAVGTVAELLPKAWKEVALLAALFEPGNEAHRLLHESWRTETAHAPRAITKGKEVPRLSAGAPARALALPPGATPEPGSAMMAGPAVQEVARPQRPGLLRLIARLFGSERAA